MNYSFFIGIDISKKTLDFAIRDQNKNLFHLKVDNSLVGLNEFKEECLARNINLSESLICCEHTGVYSQNVLALATENDFSLWLESSLRIKRSLGLQRGKSDKWAPPGSTRSESASTLSGTPIRLLSGSQKDIQSVSCAN